MSDVLPIRPIHKEYMDQHEYPTIYVEAPGGNTLDFCGVVHSNDPDGYMIGRVRRELGAFLDKPSDHPKLVLLEGWHGPRTNLDELSEDDVVRRSGEEALADRMTRQAGVDIASPEPPLSEEFAQLCEEFPAHHVFYWLVARQAVQWGREVPLEPETQDGRRRLVQQEFEDFAGVLTSTLGHVPSFQEVGASFSVVADTHRELFGSELDWNDLEHFDAQANPLDTNSTINEIHNRSNYIRDTHIAAEIKKAIDDGKDVFALYGDGHAYTLEPALRALGK